MDLYSEIKYIFPEILKSASPEFLEEFRSTPPDGLIDFHFTLGLLLRNKFIYQNKPLLRIFGEAGLSHPDEISLYIIKEFHKYLKK